MSNKRTFFLVHKTARELACQCIWEAPEGFKVTVEEPTRTLDQNAALWPILEEFSRQLDWPVNGQRVKLSPEEWKDILSAAFEGESIRLAQGLNGGVVMLGIRTSKMSKQRFSEFLEFLNATAADRGVTI